MYIIECDSKVIHGPGNSTVLVSNPVLTTGIDNNGTLTFDLPPVNPQYADIIPMKSTVKVLDDHEELWWGRVVDFESDFENLAPITCEGLLGYLNDSMIRPDDMDRIAFDEEMPLSDYINLVFTIHNEQVDDSKKMYLGNVTVTFPDIADYNPAWSFSRQMTKATIEAVRSRFGGHFQARMESGEIKVDYLKEFTNEAFQEIIFAKNLMDLRKNITGDKIKTAIIPIGKGELTIEDVNPTGKDYIIDQVAANKYGFIIGIAAYDEIDDDEELYSKALEEFPKLTGIRTTLSIKAVDLSLIDKSLDAFKVGDLVRIISPPHNINELLQVSEIRLDLTNPDKSEITLGDKEETLTGRST